MEKRAHLLGHGAEQTTGGEHGESVMCVWVVGSEDDLLVVLLGQLAGDEQAELVTAGQVERRWVLQELVELGPASDSR